MTPPPKENTQPRPHAAWANCSTLGGSSTKDLDVTSLLINNPSERIGSDKTELGHCLSGKTISEMQDGTSILPALPGFLSSLSRSQTLGDLNRTAHKSSHLTPINCFSSCHFLLPSVGQRMLSDFQPPGDSKIFSLEGTAGEAKAEAKKGRREKIESDPRHKEKRGIRGHGGTKGNYGVTDKGCCS